MNNTQTKSFTLNNIEFTANEAGTHFYKTINGKKTRITRDGYEEALADYEYAMRKQIELENKQIEEAAIYGITVEETEDGNYIVKLDGEPQTDAIARAEAVAKVFMMVEIAINTAESEGLPAGARIASMWDGDTTTYTLYYKGKLVSGYWTYEEALKAGQALKEQAEQKELEKKATKKATKKKARKDVALTIEFEGKEYSITAKQKDFMEHLPDTCFWERGLDSAPWIPILCDEIGGQFAGKPLSVGAMVSTLREKGLLEVGCETFMELGTNQKRKMKYLILTDAGKAMAKAVGGLD